MKKKLNRIKHLKEAFAWFVAFAFILLLSAAFVWGIWMLFDWFVTSVISVDVLKICEQFGFGGSVAVIFFPFVLIILIIIAFFGFSVCRDMC